MELLLGLGVDVNSRDPEGLTPLHFAAGWGSKRVCEILLANGADKTMIDQKGRSPEDLALQNQRPAIARFLHHWLQVRALHSCLG